MGFKNCILLVDDNALVRINLRREFEGAGWYVCGEAASGPEAIEKAKELNPHLIQQTRYRVSFRKDGRNPSRLKFFPANKISVHGVKDQVHFGQHPL